MQGKSGSGGLTHDNHFTGEKSVPTPLSCTSVLQTWTKDTGDSLQAIRPEPIDQLVVRKPKNQTWKRSSKLRSTPLRNSKVKTLSMELSYQTSNAPCQLKDLLHYSTK
ncbi:unnamed protein product [Gadus morhua 'NCC']